MPAAAKCCSYCGSIISCVAPKPCASTTAGCGPAPGGIVSQAAHRVPSDGKSTRSVGMVAGMPPPYKYDVRIATLLHVRYTCQGAWMRARFTTDEIADAALRLVDESGVGALSM